MHYYVNMKTLRNIYFAIYESHQRYSCIVWAQNINTARRLTILQKKALHEFQRPILSFKSTILLKQVYNIFKSGDKITLENILFVSKPIKRQVPSIFYDWFTFSGNLRRYETCWSVTNYLNIPTFQTQKYGHFRIRASAIRSWNYTHDMLKINLSLKNSTLKGIKYFLTKYFIESYQQFMVGKGVTHPFSRSTTPFSKFPPFLEIQDAPTFHRSIGKTKVLNSSCNQFVYHFYPQSILVLEECLQKW